MKKIACKNELRKLKIYVSVKAIMENLNLPLTIKLFKENSSKEAPFVAYNPELDISSCGKNEEEAKKMLTKAIELLLKGARDDGTLKLILEEAGLSLQASKEGFPKTYFSFFNFPLGKNLYA
ncbi:MAG: hypothetical protein UT37_C0009G0021 [Parcubacteria group bacterium GW2011_GWA2_39_18]|nr:MAG: hypothetical protein UT37_C0009G0021 [Parcubacteria group bacterium GW2011_GWA2_39_18]